MVSKARLDLPLPDRPVMTTSRSRGNATSTSLRLCSRAPRTTIRSWGTGPVYDVDCFGTSVLNGGDRLSGRRARDHRREDLVEVAPHRGERLEPPGRAGGCVLARSRTAETVLAEHGDLERLAVAPYRRPRRAHPL